MPAHHIPLTEYLDEHGNRAAVLTAPEISQDAHRACVEALEMLVSASEAHCPRAAVDDPEIVAETRDWRHALDAARAALARVDGEG